MTSVNIPAGSTFQFGLAQQTGEGVPNAVAEVLTPAWGGGFQSTQDIQPYAVSDTSYMIPGYYKKTAGWSGSVTFGAFTASSAALYKGLLGSDTKTGAGAPYSHALRVAQPNASWWSFWQNRPDNSTGLWERYEDGTITAIEAQWAAGDPLKLVVEAAGKTVTVGTTPTMTNSIVESYYTNDTTATAAAWPAIAPSVCRDYFTATGSTLAWVNSGVTVSSTAGTYVESGSIKISRATELLQTTALTPTFRSQGLFDVALSTTLLFKDYADYRNSYFGSNTGTSLSQTVTVGAIDFKFLAASAATRFIRLMFPAQTVTSFTAGTTGALVIQVDPAEVDPAGGPVRQTITSHFQKDLTATADSIGVLVVDDISTAI